MIARAIHHHQLLPKWRNTLGTQQKRALMCNKWAIENTKTQQQQQQQKVRIQHTAKKKKRERIWFRRVTILPYDFYCYMEVAIIILQPYSYVELLRLRCCDEVKQLEVNKHSVTIYYSHFDDDRPMCPIKRFDVMFLLGRHREQSRNSLSRRRFNLDLAEHESFPHFTMLMFNGSWHRDHRLRSVGVHLNCCSEKKSGIITLAGNPLRHSTLWQASFAVFLKTKRISTAQNESHSRRLQVKFRVI